MESSHTKFYGAYNKNREILLKSSSGGVFDALAREILKQGGCVIGVIFSKSINSVEYSICSDINELDLLRGSKYIQVSLGNLLVKIKELLDVEDKRPVLITGTPCHIEGIRKYLEVVNANTSNVYLCSLICHGSASPMIWNDFVKAELYDKKLDNVFFKDKRNGWEHPTPIAFIEDREFDIKRYVHLFNNDMILRPCCYSCRFTTTERMCDLTIGDFWGVRKTVPQLYNKDGTSLVLTHTSKGEKLLHKCADGLRIMEVERKDAMQHNLEQPTKRPIGRERFWIYYRRNGIKRTIRINEIIFLSIRIRLKFQKLLKRRDAI